MATHHIISQSTLETAKPTKPKTWFHHKMSGDKAIRILPGYGKASRFGLCVPKTKSERIDDEVRPGWRANL